MLPFANSFRGIVAAKDRPSPATSNPVVAHHSLQPQVVAQPSSALRLKECGYYDVPQAQEICRSLLYAWGAACLEKTSGAGLFNHIPADTVESVRKEMIEYVQYHVDAYATGSRGRCSQLSEPVKVIQEILENFVKSKRNIYRRVSSTIFTSEAQDDRIEEFAEELEKRRSWVVWEREALAKLHLRRVDRSKMNHCDMKFESMEELAQHKKGCPQRPVMCENENCEEIIAAMNARSHDETCPFKMLPCEQKCKAMVMRREMQEHCRSVCLMKPIKCPFHEMGCAQILPQSLMEHHCSQSTCGHLFLLLQNLQKQQTSLGNHAHRILSLEKILSYASKASEHGGNVMGSVHFTVREMEAKIQALEQEVTKLRQDLKVLDVSADVLQLRREVRNLYKPPQNL